MARQANAAPVVIKRKRIVAGGGRHGGGWKVAYADFVTAMMAFFMLMWLLNATTEKQRKGLADYFNPTIPVNRISGGGDGAFGGDSVLSEQVLARNGSGASTIRTTDEARARGETGTDTRPDTAERDGAERDGAQRDKAEIDKILTARGGESMTMERLLRHVVTRVTDEGLVIEVFDLPDAPLFDGLTDEPTQVLAGLMPLLAEVLGYAANPVAVQAHVRALPVTLAENPVWPLSSDRAVRMHRLLLAEGLAADRVARVTGFADRRPVTPDPAAARNNRIELVLLRRDR